MGGAVCIVNVKSELEAFIPAFCLSPLHIRLSMFSFVLIVIITFQFVGVYYVHTVQVLSSLVLGICLWAGTEGLIRKLWIFGSFLSRDDIGIILINQYIAEMIRHVIDAHTLSIPAVLEIPSKEHPYDASKDSILRRAKGMFSTDDFR